MSVPLSDTELAEIRAEHERTTHAGWRDSTAVGVLLREVDWLRAELAAGSCPADCPCRQIPLTARWDGEVSYPNPADTEDTETVVCCVAEGGHPAALMLDDEHREALGLQLLLPDGDGEVDPQHLELARENEQLRTQVAEMRGWITEAATICRDHNTSPVKRLAELTEIFNG